MLIATAPSGVISSFLDLFCLSTGITYMIVPPFSHGLLADLNASIDAT